MSLLLGLDVGTTSTIGTLIDTDGGVVAVASRPSELISRHANWAEEDPARWWSNVCAIVPTLLTKPGITASEIAAVGVAGMVPTVILLDENREPLRHSIQQNDARAVDEIEAMRRAIDPDDYFARTGGSINQQLVAPKLRWLERYEPDCMARAKTVLGSYDYVTCRLTGSLSVEQNWALEAGFVDLARGGFDQALVRLGGISSDHLPPLRASHDLVGEVTSKAAVETGLAAGTPVVAGCADHIASAFVAGASQDGDLVVKYGGAGDIMLSCSTPRTDPRLFIDYHIVPGLFFTNGCMAASGSVLNWVVANLAKAEAEAAKAAGRSVHAYLDRQAGDLRPGAGGLVLLPYFLGEKTPLHDPQARGHAGRSRPTSRAAAHMARSTRIGRVRFSSPYLRVRRDGPSGRSGSRLRRRRCQRSVGSDHGGCVREADRAAARTSRLQPRRGVRRGHGCRCLRRLGGNYRLCPA